MKRLQHVSLRLLAAIALLAAAGPAAAAIGSVSATPPAANVPVGQAGHASVLWEAATVPGTGGGGPGSVVTSSQGVFRAGTGQGPIIGTNNVTVQGVAQAALQQAGLARIPESIRIPARVILRAQELDVTQIVYQREFDDGDFQQPPANVGELTLHLAGGQSGAFGVSRLALRFPDGAREQIVPEGAETFVLADITHTGTGRLEARWEIAEPATTRGTPVFRTLALVRRQLIGSGARTTIRSPDLPTRGDGVYLVRLRVTRPETGFEEPVLRYLVNPALAPAPAPETMAVRAPAAGADYVAGMQFAWEPLTAAAVYRLEFHDQPPAREDPDATGDPAPAAADPAAPVAAPVEESVPPPVSGIVVSAAVDHTELSQLALSNLPPGRTYWWRVVAFDGHGRLVGRSPLRALTIPPSP